VEWAVGKAGRADTALDPAPVSMVETIIQYKPEYEKDSTGNPIHYRYDETAQKFARKPDGSLVQDPQGRPYRQWREHIKTERDIWDEILKVTKVPGVTSAPYLQPIEGRIVMLQSGMRAPMGIKIYGPDLKTLEKASRILEKSVRNSSVVEPSTVIAETVVGKPYLELEWNREKLAAYNLNMEDAQNLLAAGVGGQKAGEVILGRVRHPVIIRFNRDFRGSMDSIMDITVTVSKGNSPVKLKQVASLKYRTGAQAIKGEDSELVSYLVFDKKTEYSEGEAVTQLIEYLDQNKENLKLPENVTYKFAGNYENQIRAAKRMRIIIPAALLIIFALLSMKFRSSAITAFVFTSVIVAASGGFILLWLYQQQWFLNFSIAGMDFKEIFQVGPVNLSVAVWVGFLSLFGIATDDGVLISSGIQDRLQENPPENLSQIKELILSAGQERIRPCLMTTATTLLALLPVLTSTGRGATIMLPMALPIFGGMLIELITLFIVPVLYYLYLTNRHKTKMEV
jgi:Cu(I)/Ag(I) efflux system membrane protein CusA/SilA